MKLEDLVGEHELSGVDFGQRPPDLDRYQYDAANTMTFVLDGKAWMAIEDPGDGYRSSLADLVEATEPVKNTFEPCRVVGRYRTEYSGGVDDVLELIDALTGKTVLEVGTVNADDYYPNYVANFTPEHMAVNQGKSVPARPTESETGTAIGSATDRSSSPSRSETP